MVGRSRRPASFPSLPVVFWLLASSLARRPTEPCLPAGQGPKNLAGPQRSKVPGLGIFGTQAPTKEGLDGVERTPRIRRTATRKRRRQDRARDGRSSAEDSAGPNSRPRQRTPNKLVGAQRNQGEPSEPALHPPDHGSSNPTSCPGVPPAAAARHLAAAGLAVRRRQPPTKAGHRRRTARGDRPPKGTGHPRSYSRRSWSGTAP